MFDTISNKLFCPFCGTLNEQFQTKDTSCMLDDWTIEDLIRFYPKMEKIEIHDECKNCKKWMSINLDLFRLNLTYKIKRYEDIEKEKKDITKNG